MNTNAKISAMIFMSIVAVSGYAQVKVNQLGNVKIGAETFWDEG